MTSDPGDKYGYGSLKRLLNFLGVVSLVSGIFLLVELRRENSVWHRRDSSTFRDTDVVAYDEETRSLEKQHVTKIFNQPSNNKNTLCSDETALASLAHNSGNARISFLSQLSALRRENQCGDTHWLPTYGNTSVEFLIGSFDRAQELRVVLRSLEVFVTEAYSVTVLYLGSHDDHVDAYELLSKEYPQHRFLRRSQSDYFQKLRQAIFTSSATNFVILSDDTMFFRSCAIRKFATLQNLLESDLMIRYSVQLRAATRDPHPDILEELLPTWGLPYVNVVNCSRSLGHWNPVGEKFFTCCYDRQIDGAMFTRRTLEREMSDLQKYKEPNHPGDLEGFWMELAGGADWTDLTIFPVDRVLMNAGMSLGTVRDDRKHLEDPGLLDIKDGERETAAKAFLDGCFLQPPPFHKYLEYDKTHGSFQMPLEC